MPDIAEADTKQLFLDRDLSWLEFNRRVLHEALDERTPLLERVKFLAIFTSNLDEYFMKRVGSWKSRLEEHEGIAEEGPERHLREIRQAILPLLAAQADVFTSTLVPSLAKNGIHLLNWKDLSENQRQFTEQFFHRNLFPVLTPLAVDPGHPFPFISNLSTSLGILLLNPRTQEKLFARLKVPDVFPQWISLPAPEGNPGEGPQQFFLRLAELVHNHLAALFPGMEVLEVMPFRITRSADVDLDEEGGENLVEQVEKELRQRRIERVVRLEYSGPSTSAQLPMLLRKLRITESDVYAMPAELDFTDLFSIAGLPRPELLDPPWQPLVPPELADEQSDFFALVRARDFMVHHPYESFDATAERFIRRASADPRVLAMKMTVYRVGSDTPLLDALIRAAETGKQVACLVEVTARFDEKHNLKLANALEKAGVHVVYGMIGLKTHCKTALVVRQDDDGIRCYVHIGTGNYNAKTAHVYTDLGLFTSSKVLTDDIVNLFHYLTGCSAKTDYAALLVAPVNMRERFLAMIQREIAHREAGRPARIVAKMNQLEDRQICLALLAADRAGVHIDLIVRGFCVLRPGMPGQSENIRIISVIGRFLEHSRIYFFQNGQDDPLAGDFFIGSADWMERNLSNRVEAITPIEARPLRERLWEILQTLLLDARQAWDLQSDGSYRQRTPVAPGLTQQQRQGTHVTMMELTRLHCNHS